MGLETKIADAKAFNSAINSAKNRGTNLVNSYADLVTFAYLQISEHGNGSPATALRAAIPSFAAKPKGFTVKGLDRFISEYTALDVVSVLDGKPDSAVMFRYSKTKAKTTGKTYSALPSDNCRFWEFSTQQCQPLSETPDVQSHERAAKRLIKKLLGSGMSQDDVKALLASALQSELTA
jgi:hypothetical protein